MFKSPIVAFDGSEPSLRALQAGIEFAQWVAVPLRVVIVDEGVATPIQIEALAATDARVVEAASRQDDAWRDGLEGRVRELCAGIEVLVETITGDEIGAIVDAVHRHGSDLLIVGLRHHPGLIERLLPKTAQALTERVPCSVLGVR